MSGHSKWSQIKHQKNITDQKRGQLFSKLSKLISLATRKGADPKSNTELRNAIEQARSFNIPNNNIERAVKRISDKSAAQLEELLVEAIASGNVALKIRAITNNRNRTIAEIKNILNENSAKIVPPGSISWMFNQPISASRETRERINKLLEALDNNNDVEEITTNLVS